MYKIAKELLRGESRLKIISLGMIETVQIRSSKVHDIVIQQSA
jgi:hypothetical protein